MAGWANFDGEGYLPRPRVRVPITAKGPTLAGQPFHSGSSTKPHRVDGEIIRAEGPFDKLCQ